jgi:hypothetical protein
MFRAAASLAAVVLLSGCSVFGIRSGYEQPAYTVVEQIEQTVEIRDYGSRLAAEATVEAGNAEAGRNDTFRLLFDYISGANQSQSEVAMMAPVEVGSEKIAMTAPVETAVADDGRYTMRFFLPSTYTRATVPQPTDPRVRIVELPEMTVAVERFSGSRDEDSVKRRKAQLLNSPELSGWRPIGAATSLFYDPPWTLPFLRRNEVVVPVARAVEAG